MNWIVIKIAGEESSTDGVAYINVRVGETLRQIHKLANLWDWQIVWIDQIRQHLSMVVWVSMRLRDKNDCGK